MSELGHEYRRWTELMDREAIGEPLAPEERVFCEAFEARNPAAARERALLEELADMDVSAQTSDTRSLVDGALERLAAETLATEERAQQKRLDGLRRKRRTPRTAWVAGMTTVGAIVAAAAAATLFYDRAEPEPGPEMVTQSPTTARMELVYVSGEVTVNGERTGADATLLSEGDVLSVGAQGSACLAMDPEIDLCLQAGSRLALSRTDGPWRRLDLERGKVAVQLGPQPDGMRLSVVADGVWSTAIGTAFTVTALGRDSHDNSHDNSRDNSRDSQDNSQDQQGGPAADGEDGRAGVPGNRSAGVHTTVLSGKVRVGDDGENARIVSAHQRAHVADGRAVVSELSRNEESPEWALLRPATLWDSPVSATLRVGGLPSGADIHLDGERIGAAPLSTLVPTGSHRLEVHIDGVTMLTRQIVARAGQASAFDFSDEALLTVGHAQDTVPVAPVPKERARKRAPSAVDMLAEARQLMRQSRFEEAANHYAALRRAHPDSPEARTVLVPLGQLQLRLGRAEQALGDLDRYLGGGNGALGEEARHTRIRALRALGRDAEEALAIEEFLARHPKSFHATALGRRLERLKD